MAKAPLNDAQKKAAISIGRSYWASVFKRQYPKATKEEKQASWKQSRKQYVALGRRAVRQLTKASFTLSGGK